MNEKDIRDRFAAAIRKLRSRSGLSQEKFARKPNLTGATIGNWEDGGLPDFVVYVALCHAYGEQVPFLDYVPDVDSGESPMARYASSPVRPIRREPTALVAS